MTRKTNFIKLRLLSAFILFCVLPVLAVSLHNYLQIRAQVTELALMNSMPLQRSKPSRSNAISNVLKKHYFHFWVLRI